MEAHEVKTEEAEQLNTLDKMEIELDQMESDEIDFDADVTSSKSFDMETGEMVSAMLMIGFELVASRRGEHWRLSPSEAKQTGAAVGDVLDKYFPDMTSHGAEITAVMACSMVLLPRIGQDKAINNQIKEAQKTKATKEKDFDLTEGVAVDGNK
jgi:hypothetical protein